MQSIPFTITVNRLATLFVFILLVESVQARSAKETVLHSFQGGSDGAEPLAGLVADQKGNLYGTTSGGGSSVCNDGCGTVFELSRNADGTWSEIQLYRFSGGTDGAFPNAGVVFDRNGNLYGSTLHGGATGDGTVFRLSPPSHAGDPWTETVLHNFVDTRDGYYCLGGLTFDLAGNLYGAGLFGGRYGGGTVFQLVPPTQGESWTLNVLHAFKGTNDGIDPLGPVVLDKNGSVYGTTRDGVVFRLIPPSISKGNWNMNVLQRLGSVAGTGALLPAQPASLFGTTALGGTTNNGTVFQLMPGQPGQPWTAVVLYEFLGGNDGSSPLNGLIADASGNLYGVTQTGGLFNYGTVFRLSHSATPASTWTKTTLYNFEGGTDGADPGAGVILTGRHFLYGTTTSGGSSGNGTAFQLGP